MASAIETTNESNNGQPVRVNTCRRSVNGLTCTTHGAFFRRAEDRCEFAVDMELRGRR